MYICVYVYVLSVYRYLWRPDGELEFLELELQVVMSWCRCQELSLGLQGQ